MEKKELTKTECDEINLRMQIIQKKNNEIRLLSSEAKLIDQTLKSLYTKLIDQYDLDKDKNYRFDGRSLVEVVDGTKKKVSKEEDNKKEEVE